MGVLIILTKALNESVEYFVFSKASDTLMKIRNARRCNKHDDLLYLGFILKISIFLEAYIHNPVKNI